jgi:serpin B
MRSIRPAMLVSIWTALLILCGCDDTTTCPTEDVARSSAPETLELRITRTNEFALDLYGKLRTSEGNLIVSPHSIVTAFAMAYAGARGATEQEIARVCHFNYPQAGFHSVVRELNDLLESRGASVDPQAFQLSIASSAWGREGATYLQSYVDTLLSSYGAGLRLLAFETQPEAARLTINQWVLDQTGGLIQDLIPPGKVTPYTYLVLVNTIYFRANWRKKFDPSYTRSRPFTRLDGSQVNVPVMSGEDSFGYDIGDGYQALALPYVGGEVSMLLILPDPGSFDAFEASFSVAQIDTIASRLRSGGIIVDLPKFYFETEYELGSTLESMGMATSFGPGANFSGIDGTDDGIPWIDFVAHKAFIGIDEYGTLAAAGTGMGFTIGVPPRFSAVHPFIFVIRDHATGTILFLGRVLDPSM